MKLLLLFSGLVLSISLAAQYPSGGIKSRLGYQTTGDGLVYRGSGAPAYSPGTMFNAWMYLDTTNYTLYMYRNFQWTKLPLVNNGLNLDGAYVQLGGTLVENTQVERSTYTLDFGKISGTNFGYASFYGTDPHYFGVLTKKDGVESGLTIGNKTFGFEVDDASDVFSLSGRKTGFDATYLGSLGVSQFKMDSTKFFIRGPISYSSHTVADANVADYQLYRIDNSRALYLKNSAVTSQDILGAGTTNRIPLWTSLNTLGNSNLSDNNTVVSILNSKPFALGQWTTAGRPTGTDGYIGRNTSTGFDEGYFSSQWRNYITSTGASANQVAHFSNAGVIIGNTNYTYTQTGGVVVNNTGTGAAAVFTGTANPGTGLGNDVRFTVQNQNATSNKVQFVFGGATLARSWSFGTDPNGTGENVFFLYNVANNRTPFYVTSTGRVLLGSSGIPSVSLAARTLHVEGEARISDLTTDTPTRIVGADADGDLGAISVSAGLAMVSGSLGIVADSLDRYNGILYVAKNGNNSTAKRNNPRLPFLTIKAAVTASRQGDLIYIYPGVYREGGTTLGRDSINFYCSPGVTVSNAVITDDYGTSDMDGTGYVRWFGSGVFDTCTVSIQHNNMRYHIEGDSINLNYVPFWKFTNYNDIRLKFRFRSVRTYNNQLVWIPGASTELTYTRMNLIFEIDRIYSPGATKGHPLIHFANGAGGTATDAKSKLVDCSLIFDIKNIELVGAAAVGSFPRLQGLIFGAGGVSGRVHLLRSNITFNSDYITQTGITGSTYQTPFQGFENSNTLFGLGTFKLDSSRMNFNIKSIHSDIHAFRIGEMYQGNKGMVNINGNFTTRQLATFHVIQTSSGATGDTSILIRVNGNFSSDKEVVTTHTSVPTEKITWSGNYNSFADKAVFATKSDNFTITNAVLQNKGTTADIYAAEARTVKVASVFADGLNLSSNVSTPSLENIGSPKLETYYTITSTSSPQTLSSTYSDNLINQGGTQATFTLNMPASPEDGQVCYITFNNAISTLTIDGNGETIVGSAVTTGVPGSQRKFKFYSGIGWIKQY